jgi:3-phosphoshikimate 1-carboxyvinyltransferase
MKALIHKSDFKGTVRAPSSKSYSLRGLMCAALAKGKSELIYPLTSDDTEAALSVMGKLGISVTQQDSSWQVVGGNFRAPNSELYCGDSATTMRFVTAICALVPGKSTLTAGPSLAKRPVKPLIDALRQLGVKCSCNGEVAPVVVEGRRLKGGVTELPGDISSQFVSALLLIAPFAEQGVTIKLTTALESKPYVLMTIESLAQFGVKVEYSDSLREFKVARQDYKPTKYTVEGDWSSASYLLSLGAIGGPVTTQNLNPSSLQGDKAMLAFLWDMGANIESKGNTITVRKQALNAIHADLADGPDLLPTVAVMTALANGTSELIGIERARLKESDRVAAMTEGLTRMGISVREEPKKMTITGGRPHGATIDSKNDHRIAMAFSILGAIAGDTIIQNAECVSKTFPDYWDVFKSLGGKVELDVQ